MGNLSAPEALSQRFAPRPESVTQARRFVRTALSGVAPDMLATAELLVSELMTNAVLHARTEAEVSAWSLGRTVHVQVSDHRPSRGVVSPDRHPYASVGLGLTLVEELASCYGVRVGDGQKTVWCELWPEGTSPPPSGWGHTLPPDQPGVTITLVDLPDALYVTSLQHRHALLRELTLAAFAGDPVGVRPEELATAHDMSNVVSARVTAALEEQRSAAGVRSLQVTIPADATPALFAARRTLDLGEEAAGHERLLTLPSLPQNRVFRQWLFDQITGQISGKDPTAWTEVSRGPSASLSELAPWDADQVQTSRTPTVAADDTHRIIAANDPAGHLLGWQANELVGQWLTALIPEHLRERHRSAFSSLLLTGEPRILGRSVPLPALHRDGRLVPIRLVIQPQQTADGRTVFVAQLSPRSTEATTSSQGPRTGLRVPQPEEDESPSPTGPGPVPGPSAREPDVSALERLSLLADTGSALGSASVLSEGLRQVCHILSGRLADWCVVDLLEKDGCVSRACVTHRDPGRVPSDLRAGQLPPLSEAARGPLARVLRGAGSLLLREIPASRQAQSRLDAHHLEVFEQLGGSSALIAPLQARRDILGALTLAREDATRPFTEDDLSLVDDLVGGLALGVDNTRLYQETRDIAERLQHSLLPALPDVGHLQMAARYAPSSTTAQVGGDWYDSFIVPNGATAMVIGDVAGHDLEAAVAMSQLRNMLRGIAVDRQEPPESVLRRLDRANHSLNQEVTATCVYGLVKGPETGPWYLEHSSAGHPPPLLTTAEGATRFLGEDSGLLLGMDPDPPRPRARNPLPAHSTVLLYTDGLIERRGESFGGAMDLLSRHTAALAREPLDVFCDELLIGLGADNADDIALLALRPTPLR
ncbi:SpoIIE family protein phosphatase [Streptomyces reniochalinae]|uniref:protein-serine/threonine phosphatase n=1 Tax=Streptomyces reniochalinae TaxID=2250578 RepID=A0A367EKC5_9ACTN|nr:SpoIIE family protein phosphatase [Streptomyces reniochalinae]RCG17640.1 PAS domain S-box protein [Streptomyces reniochalinae]